MIKTILPALFLCFALSVRAQYSETFTGQNGKGLVDAICPAGTTSISNCGSICTVNASDNTSTCSTVPPSFTGVTWSIVKGPAVTYFTDLSGFGFEFTSPDDFGVVSDRMQADDPDNEICWLSPTLNIGSAGAVTISVDVSQTGGLEAGDTIKCQYSLNGGAFTTYAFRSGAFAAATLTSSGLTGTTLVIRVCAITNGAGEQIYFDNVSVPQAGVTQGCVAPVITKTVYPTGSCNPNSGTIEITATGGTAGYNVAWGGTSSGNPPGTEIASSGGTYTIPALAAGTYTVTVTDLASCSATTTASITTATALSLSTQILPASCNSLSDGEIDLTVSNGVAPYTYSWNNLPGSPDPQDQTGLAAGTYTVTVTDHAGCTATTSATVGTASAGAYSETFSIAGKGILDPSTCSGANGTTCTNNNFVGVNWSIYGLSTLTGIDLIGDYFKTTGGVLEAFDIDQDVCWESPVLDINPPGTGVGFSVGLNWTSFDQEPSPDYLDVEYSLDGGSWMRAPNAAGGGTSGHTVVYANGTGLANNGSTTVNVSGLSGSTLRIRVCGLVNGDDESFRIDNVSVPLAQGLACPQEIHVKQNTTNIADGGSFNYGSVNIGSNSSLPFTIENQGSFTLTLTGTPPNYVVKGGTNPGDFTITQPVSGTITGGNSTMFTVVFAPGALGARSCTLTIGNNDSDEDPYNITLNGTGACPAITFTGTPTATCAGTTNGQIVVSGVTGGTGPYMYSKDNGANYQPGATFTGLAPATYQVVVKDANNCTSSATGVTVNSLPAPSCSISGPTSTCTNSTGNIYSGTGGMSAYSWGISGSGTITSVTTGSSVTVTAGASGTYTVSVTITDANGCTASCSQPVTINPLPTGVITGPTPSPGPNNDTLCTTLQYVFTGPPGMSAHKWGVSANGTIDGSATGSSVLITVNSGSSLTVRDTITDANGCTSVLTLNRNVQQSPTCSINGPLTVCGGSAGNVYTVTSNAGTFGYYVWSISGDGVITSSPTSGYNVTSVTVTAGASGTYTVTVDLKFDFNTCLRSCSETVTINSASAPTITGPTAVCSGGSVTLDAGAGYSTYAWSGGGGSGQTATYSNITSPTTYTVTVTSNGCTGTDTHSVTVNANPTPTITGPTSVCHGGSVVLDAGAYASYAWSNGGGSGQTATFSNITTPTTYTVTVTDGNGCMGTDTQTVTVNANPTPTITGPTAVCSGGSVLLDAGAYAGYAWSTGGGSGQTATFSNITSPTTYTVTVTDGNGCTGTDTQAVSVNANPTPTITGPAVVCSGGSALLDAGAGYAGYAWSNGGGSGQTATFSNIAAPSTFTVTVTDGNGCTGTDTHVVNVNPSPTPAISGPVSPVCPGSNALLDAGTGYVTYAWSNGGGSGQTATYNNILVTTTYTVTVTDGNGCTGTDTHTVTVQSCTIDFSGKIIFSNNNTLGVNNALVSLTGSATGSDLSDINGDFFIATAVTSGSFTLKPAKTINKLNGVNVADATAVQQHVALIAPITDPYKLVAADVNKSNSVNTLDASLITQSLLGNPAALAQFSTSWRFVPTSHVMTNPPWGFPEQRDYVAISTTQTNQDFYGIKTGDVTTAYANPANFGAGEPFVLTTLDQVLKAGENIDVSFNAGQLDDLAAFQFALAFDPAQLQFEAVESNPGGLPLTAEHFGAYNAANGELRAVWAQAAGIRVEEAAPAFRLRFTSLQSGAKLSEALRIDEELLPAQAYTSTLAASPVQLTFTESTGTGTVTAANGVQLFQNRPNPFKGTTAIGFVLPEACTAQLRVFDASGRMLAERKAQYATGRHEALFDLNGATGVLYYELTTPFGVLSRKMVAVEK